MKKQRNKMKSIVAKKINEAYQKKYEEFNKLLLDDLKVLYEESTKDKSKRIGGIHKRAFLDVVSAKMQNESIKSTIEEVKDDNN